MSSIVYRIGPSDHGRQMLLDEFEQCDGDEMFLYELGRGMLAVIDVPKGKHFLQVQCVRNQFVGHMLTNPGRIVAVAGGAECRIPIFDLNSARHPDVAIYLTPMPLDESPWAVWIPEIVIEIVSLGSEQRDYVEKREEYFRFGVLEYWIVDAQRREVLVLRRRGGKWVEKTLGPTETYCTRLLPGFEFRCASVFEAADSADRH